MQTIHFNTGRLYTEAGQRIAATKTPDGGILFTDVDRMIDGFISAETVTQLELQLTERDVLWAYDHHDKSKCYEHGTWKFNETLTALRRIARGEQQEPEYTEGWDRATYRR